MSEVSAVYRAESERCARLATIAVEADSSEKDCSSTRLFVSNFPFSWTQDHLADFFRDFSPVENVEIVYNERGSKGFGFVTITDPDRCQAARDALNHTVVQGRRVEVRRAHKHKRARNAGPLAQSLYNARVLQMAQSLQALHSLSMLGNIRDPRISALLSLCAQNPSLNPMQSNGMGMASSCTNLQSPGYDFGSSLSSIGVSRGEPLSSGSSALSMPRSTTEVPVSTSSNGNFYNLFSDLSSNLAGMTLDTQRTPSVPPSDPFASNVDLRLWRSESLEHTLKQSDRSISTPNVSAWPEITSIVDGALEEALNPLTHVKW